MSPYLWHVVERVKCRSREKEQFNTELKLGRADTSGQSQPFIFWWYHFSPFSCHILPTPTFAELIELSPFPLSLPQETEPCSSL